MVEAMYQKFDPSPSGGDGESSHHPVVMKSLLTIIVEDFSSPLSPKSQQEIVLAVARHDVSRLVREVCAMYFGPSTTLYLLSYRSITIDGLSRSGHHCINHCLSMRCL